MTERTLALVMADSGVVVEKARRLAGRQLVFIGHLIVYWFTFALLLTVA
jgi:hypothetical protein